MADAVAAVISVVVIDPEGTVPQFDFHHVTIFFLAAIVDNAVVHL
jgi:hypothetical protein